MSPVDPAPGPGSESSPPPPLTTAAGIAGIQGVVAVLLAVADAVDLHGDRLVMGLTVAVFFAAYGAALVACAVGLYRLRSWARGPVLLAQLIWLGVAWSFRASPTTVVAAVLAVSAAIALLGLLAPASVDALNRGED